MSSSSPAPAPTRIAVRNRTFDVVPTRYTTFWERVQDGRWEPGIFDVLDSWIDAETTVLDVGAWQGVVSLYASPVARHVYALEPDPTAFRVLEENLELNGYANVTLLPVALATSSGTTRMGTRTGHPGDSMSTLEASEGDDAWPVETFTLADLCQTHGIDGPLFIKVDVEGYEFELLPRLAEELRGKEFTLHLALHPYWRGQDITGPFRRVRRRLRMARDNAALARALRGFTFYDTQGRRISQAKALLASAASGLRRRGSVLTFGNRPVRR